ncbi:MAG: type II toxin-antitoxin system RelE/ParE family toxin, partial [Rhodoferax sp.]|nr:type II toxin-antitoxin system RelE/ParE family toxin [Rhodoferax sp.]
MNWQVQQTRRFARVYKKLTNATLIADTDTAVATVADNPDVGERKKGDLAELWV